MKRSIYSILIVLVLIIAGTYIFIPQKLKVSSAITYTANGDGLFRYLIADSNWKKWWPGEITSDNNTQKIFHNSDYDYSVEKIRYRSFELNLTQKEAVYNTLLRIVSFKTDSIGIEIEAELNAGSNPVKRISKYLQAKKIKQSFDDVLASLHEHTKNVKDLYDYNIRNEKVEMQFLLSTSKSFPHYPTSGDIYSLVSIVRNYISKTNGKEEFFPMLNIETSDSINYYVRIGVPVNKKIAEAENISLKQMVKNGNILVTDVTGDTKTINEAINKMEQYIQDYQRSIIAIPFQSLITDRSKEPDSTKWVTKIFYPVV